MSENRKNGRTVQLLLRLTSSEKEKIIEQAKTAKMSVADYLVSLSENKKIVVMENIPHLLLEITRIGTNINQIAHTGNSQRYIDKVQLNKVLQYMEDVKAVMQNILSELYYNEIEEITLKKIDRQNKLILEELLILKEKLYAEQEKN